MRWNINPIDNRSKPFVVFIFALLFIAGIPLAARDFEILVVDNDLEEPLAGAVIHLPDGSEINTGDNGVAAFSAADDMRGEISVSYPGYETGRILLSGDNKNQFTVNMRITEVMENRELVIEEYMPLANSTLSGRGVSLTRENVEISSEIGLIEDVMSSVKLLPGVGYSGLFNALPSIRGGEPEDLKAALDGFYIDYPYHWGGGYSIFDPKTIESAQLYHGVFSARYTHTISGLLELKSKRASPDYADFGFYISTSAAGFNISHPLPDFSNLSGSNRGAVMLTGKITYWDPFVFIAKKLSRSITILSPINAVSLAPYIRSLNLMSNYRLSADTELSLDAYVGGDGVGIQYNNASQRINFLSDSDLNFNWNNLIFFLTSNLIFTPTPDKMIKTNLGVSYSTQIMNAYMRYIVKNGNDSIDNTTIEKYEDRTTGIQARVDFDWDLKNGFLFSAGIEELYRRWFENIDTNATIDSYDENSGSMIAYSRVFPKIRNAGLFSGLYSLLNYKDASGRFAAEAGLRLDHLYFIGNGFAIQTLPTLNPRLNFDYYLLKNRGGIDLLTLTAGYGLFSTMNNSIAYIDKSYGISDFDLKHGKSSTNTAGIKIDFQSGWSFNFELYYKFIFDRAYTISVTDNENAVRRYYFDGSGHIWGFDFMLRKIEGRFIDGWISYSFNYAYYHDPKGVAAFGRAVFVDKENKWYFPSFHRFSNLNMVINFKPSQKFHIYTRFGFADGVPQPKPGETISYPVSYERADGSKSTIIKYRRNTYYSDTERSGFSLPLDIKFSWFFFYPGIKARTEVYLAIENALSLFYTPKEATTVNPYTGEEEEGGGSTARFELPIPMVSFGFKWTY